MKPLLAALMFAVLATFAAAAPSTLKEVFTQEGAWKVRFPDNPLAPGRPPEPVKESAATFLARVASARSDSERKLASRVVQANRATLDPILAAAEPLDAAKVKALRTALDRIAAAKSASASDQAEVARVLAALR